VCSDAYVLPIPVLSYHTHLDKYNPRRIVTIYRVMALGLDS